jgi:DNA-binding CsgD family transcriptional regulator
MSTKSTVLTGEEREVIILCAIHPHDRHLSNSEIAQRLGVSISKVKRLIHQACLKLEAHNRNEAIYFAVRRGEINLNEAYSLDELAEMLRSSSPVMLRRIAHLLRQELEYWYVSGKDEKIICTERRQDTILTKRERDVLILSMRGLTNKEIADRLYISIGSVMIFLNRACRKLGARKRADAIDLALRQGEIGLDEITSFDELLRVLVPLGAESIEKVAQLLDQRFGQEKIPADS